MTDENTVVIETDLEPKVYSKSILERFSEAMAKASQEWLDRELMNEWKESAGRYFKVLADRIDHEVLDDIKAKAKEQDADS